MIRAAVCRGIGHRALGLAALLAFAAPALAAEGLAMLHQPVRCVVAGKYPQLDACFDPSTRVARARVYFRGEGAPDWYYVEMKTQAPCFRGTLPRPKRSLKHLSYYVSVFDRDFAEGAVAPFVTTASVVVGGAAALPAGGGEETTTTTTRPPSPTTTTTVPTTTTTLPAGCVAAAGRRSRPSGSSGSRAAASPGPPPRPSSTPAPRSCGRASSRWPAGGGRWSPTAPT